MIKDYGITVQQIHDATNGGLDIYVKYFPNLPSGAENGRKPFKYRDTERSPSSYLYKNPDGIYFLHDFGGKSYSPINFVVDYCNLSFGDAIKRIADDFNLTKKATFYKADVEFKDTKLELTHFKINVKNSVQNFKNIGPYIDKVDLVSYNFYEVESYEKVFFSEKTKCNTLLKVVATENYPIFCYSDNLDVWAKTYEPKAVKNDKGISNKHGYLGTKPKVYVHGMSRLLQMVDIDYLNELRLKIKETTNKDVKEEYQKELDETLIDEIYITSGGSDGLNVASLGKNAIWLNSETEKLAHNDYVTLKNICKNIYNIPDIDATGRKEALGYSLQYWDLKTIWLQQEKMIANGKDFRDWLVFYSAMDYEKLINQFNLLQPSALRCKFFDSPKKTNGENTYKLNLSNLHYFLTINNFFTYVQERKHVEITSKEEIVFINIGKNNIVKIVSPQIIRNFCEEFLKEKGCGLDLINIVKASPFFSVDKLEGLNRIKLNFKNTAKDSQLFFFKNLVAKVTADDINMRFENKDVYAFDKTIVTHEVQKEDKLFENSLDVDGNNRVTIHYKGCEYQNFLINASRVHWRKDLEANYKGENKKALKDKYFAENQFTLNGANLSLQEQIVQEQHFLNKCFGIGYILHRFKRSDYAKLLYIMDDLVKDNNDDANGRSGKSVFTNGIKQIFKNYFPLDGKDKTITADKHIFHGFDENNEVIEIEDADISLDLKFFYTKITTGIRVNPKNTKPYLVDFADAAKMIWTTNYGRPNLTGSDIGRLFFVSFSDFYHEKTEGYFEQRKISTDFGHQLFDDWNKKQWNLFFNFMMQCCQFYLANKNNEFLAPMDNIEINNLNSGLGDTFKNWALDYFTEENLNINIIKEDLYDDYLKTAKKYPKNMSNFKKSIKDYCAVRNRENKNNPDHENWFLNPSELANSQGRFLMNVEKDNGKKTTKEFIFIQTKPIETILIEKQTLNNNETDLPDWL